jgi:hypothetical protein
MDENHNPRQLCETNFTPTQASGPMTPTVSSVPLFLSRSPSRAVAEAVFN